MALDVVAAPGSPAKKRWVPVAPPAYHPGMSSSTVWVTVAEPLRFLLAARHRSGSVTAAIGDWATACHLVESLGVPRTEIGELVINGEPAPLDAPVHSGDRILVDEVRRPQRVSSSRFLLDVHLGTLARRNADPWHRHGVLERRRRSGAGDRRGRAGPEPTHPRSRPAAAAGRCWWERTCGAVITTTAA